MAISRKPVSSWNFDTITGSNENGNFTVLDTMSFFNGTAYNFEANNHDFITKEYIKINKSIIPETINPEDTINITNNDLNTRMPASVNILIEKSMYQNISDEMMNMFLDVYDYTFNYYTSNNKYEDEYKKLYEARKHFFNKILNKPDIEKYIEFYKWIDSSLGYMLNQLKPESSNNINYIKNTIESHILERNKVKHQLPLTYNNQKQYSKNINVIKSITSEAAEAVNKSVVYVEDSIENVYSLENIKYKNFEHDYEVLQNASHDQNATFKSKFSSVDGDADKYRYTDDQYSISNSLLNKSREAIDLFNKEQALPTGIQDKDNNFILNNVPNKTSSYHDVGPTYITFPNREILFRKRNNILIDESFNEYPKSYDIVEPSIEFNIPQHYKIEAGPQSELDLFTPYNSLINDFSFRNKIKSFSKLENVYVPTVKGRSNVSKDTLFYKIQQSSGYKPKINYFENLNVVLPRQDKIGLAEIRSKPFYAESVGANRTYYYSYFNLNLFSNSAFKILPWTYDSFNNPTNKIRTIWKNNLSDRLRTRGVDWYSSPDDDEAVWPRRYYGSYNCFEYVNKKNDPTDNFNYIHDVNPYDSIYPMDSYNDIKYTIYNNKVVLSSSKEVYGDLSPHSHIYLYKLYNLYRLPSLYVQPKPQFIHNLFLQADHTNDSTVKYVYNKSYQDELDCNIVPWYNSYEDFRINIKSITQTYSTIPEFIVSNYNQLIKDNTTKLYNTISVVVSPETGFYTPANTVPGVTADQVKQVPVPYHLKIYGNEKQNLLRSENYKVDLKNFIDKKSNKIKFKIKTVKKLLPYNGFYPQQRAMQIASIYNDVFLTDTGIVSSLERQHENPGNYSTYRVGIENTLSSTQFLFSPGILFNSIKAGVAVDWPIVTSSSDVYLQNNNSYSIKELHYRMPFESLLRPEFYMNSLTSLNKNACLAYLNPTIKALGSNYADLGNTADEEYTICSEELKKFEDSRNKKLYHLAINNYTAEIVNFFLENKKLKFIKSNTFEDPIPVVNGAVYTMDLVMRKNSNFSMFNTTISGSEQDFYIPYDSLFGPPVGSDSHTSSMAYYPYTPPYMHDDESSRLRLIYTASSDQDNLYNIMKKTKIERVNNSDFMNNTAYLNRMDLRSCFNLDILTSEENGFTWYIQAKFETPLINFNKCSYSIVTSSIHDM